MYKRQDVSPYCNCHAENDTPVIADVGMFASFDPVAVSYTHLDVYKRQVLTFSTLMSLKMASSASLISVLLALFCTSNT